MVCPSGAWFENRPHLTPSIHLAWNPKLVIVQWVGIGTHIHTHTHFNVKYGHVPFWLEKLDLYFFARTKQDMCLVAQPKDNKNWETQWKRDPCHITNFHLELILENVLTCMMVREREGVWWTRTKTGELCLFTRHCARPSVFQQKSYKRSWL